MPRTTTFPNAITGLSGSITVRFDLFGGSNGSNGTFRMDDFVLNGYTAALENWSPAGYRYGYQGSEKDDEVKGSGNSYDFGARMYDSRVGRFLSRDAREADYVPISPYSFGLNNPNYFIDIDGNTIYDSKGNEVVINKNSDGSITITGTDDQTLVSLIQNTWADSEVGKAAINKLDAKEVKVQITLISKRVIWESGDGGYGEVGGLSGEAEDKSGFTDVIEIVATDVDDISVPISKDNFSDFTIMDVNGNPYSEKKALKSQDKIIESVNNREGQSKHSDEQESLKKLTPEELANYQEATKLDKKNKTQRNINTLIYEAENVTNNYGVKGETEGKKAVGNAYQEKTKH